MEDVDGGGRQGKESAAGEAPLRLLTNKKEVLSLEAEPRLVRKLISALLRVMIFGREIRDRNT